MAATTTFVVTKEMIIGLGLGLLFSVGIVAMLVVVIKCLCSENGYTSAYLKRRSNAFETQEKETDRKRKIRPVRMDMFF